MHEPIRAWAPIRIRSSSLVQPPFLIEGSSWLNHLSRHCLPMRPGMRSAISDHLVIPALIHAIIVWSSSFVHRPLTRPGLKACKMSRGCPIRRCMRVFFFFTSFKSKTRCLPFANDGGTVHRSASHPGTQRKFFSSFWRPPL